MYGEDVSKMGWKGGLEIDKTSDNYTPRLLIEQ